MVPGRLAALRRQGERKELMCMAVSKKMSLVLLEEEECG